MERNKMILDLQMLIVEEVLLFVVTNCFASVLRVLCLLHLRGMVN